MNEKTGSVPSKCEEKYDKKKKLIEMKCVSPGTLDKEKKKNKCKVL